MSRRTKRPITTTLMAILVLVLAVTGISAFATSGFTKEWNQSPAAGDLDESTNLPGDDDPQPKSEIAKETSGQQIDATSSATQVPAGQETNIDVASSATPGQPTAAVSPDVTSSATKTSGQQSAAGAPDVTSSATVDLDDDDDNEDDDRSNITAAGQRISADQAKAIALAQIGYDAQIVSIELEADEYPLVYEIELKAGDQYFELTIHAITGAVLAQDRKSGDAYDDDDDDDEYDDD